MRCRHNFIPVLITALIIIVLVAPIGLLIHHTHQYTEYEYPLSEMSDGVYAIYYATHSNVPANNYEVVTVCCDGSVRTFRGDVYISFTNGKPYIKVKDINIANCDDIYVFVPEGTVSYQPSVNIGR